ncbi:hypothetical protein K7432_018565, partial [Basidiobolus ranarum]
MTGHRFVIDLVSWRIIWEDLEQLLQGKECGYKSMSFMQWSSMLDDYAQSLDMEVWPVQELSEPLITDLSLLELNTIHSTQTLSFSLSSELTYLLFNRCHLPFQTEAIDLMISSLAIAYSSVFNLNKMTIRVQDHGRETWREGIDISRTVGWFTTSHPLVVDVSLTDEPLVILKRVKDVRRSIPANSIVYGLLCHLNKKLESPFKEDIIQIGFNHLGSLVQLPNQSTFFQPVESSLDLKDVDSKWRRDLVFDISTRVNHDCLYAEITFSSALHSKDIVLQWLEAWQQSLTKVINQCSHLDTVEHTRSDFPLLRLSESAFDVLYNDILL